MPKIESVRALRRVDLPRVAQIVAETDMFDPVHLEPMAAPFLVEQSGEERWLVYDESAVMGVAYYRAEPLTDGSWNLLLIAVDPARHGQGIGAAMMRHVEAQLASGGARILIVETSGLPEFKRTRGFYRMLGYDEEARIRDYYANGDDKVVFRKALAR